MKWIWICIRNKLDIWYFMDVKMDFGNRLNELKSAYEFEITE